MGFTESKQNKSGNNKTIKFRTYSEIQMLHSIAINRIAKKHIFVRMP